MSEKKQSVLPHMSIEYANGSIDTDAILDDDVLTAARESLAGTTAADLRELAASRPLSVSIDESRETKYFYFEKPDADKTVIHFQPVAHDLRPQTVPQVLAMQALNNANVLLIPQNTTELTKPERKKVWRGDLSPLGEQRLRILDLAAKRGQIDLGNLALAGYSFGASDAAITSAIIAEKNTGHISSAVFAEPANITDRNVAQLGLAFAGPKAAAGKQLIDSVLQSQDPALIELWGAKPGAKNSAYMKEDFKAFAKDMAKVDNLILAAALRHARFSDDVDQGLLAMRGGTVVLHKDHDSVLTPEWDFNFAVGQIKFLAALGSTATKVVRTMSEPWIGHAIGDNPWFWASMVRLAQK